MKKMSVFIGAALYPSHGCWLDLPAFEDDILKAIKCAETVDCEEIIISDSEGIQCNEYDNIFDVNATAMKIEKLEEFEQQIYDALIDDGYNSEEAIDIIEDGDYIYFDDCYTMTDVAIRWCEECGTLDGIPENLQSYFDFEKFGRDLSYEGHFILAEFGYIEITR